MMTFHKSVKYDPIDKNHWGWLEIVTDQGKLGVQFDQNKPGAEDYARKVLENYLAQTVIRMG